MIVEILFGLYLLVLLLYSLYTGLNYYRMQASGKVHPQVITFLLPFMANVKYVTSSVPDGKDGVQIDQSLL